MSFEFQPHLQNEKIRLVPLQETDFEKLYAVASDPHIWEQHPNKDRYLRDVFKNFFEGALQSGGAFILYDQTTDEVIGSSRYYDYNPADKSIFIGYTFLAKKYWGKSYNLSLKNLMIEHAFQFIDKIYFHIGAENYRSQNSIVKTGAQKIGEEKIAYYGESEKLNFVYSIEKKLP